MSSSKKQFLFISFILLGGLILRLVLFGGDGLGDDSNYFSAWKAIYNGTSINMANNMYHHRFSYWIPQLLIWRIFGINEFTFILPVLLSSLGCIYVTFLVGKELFSPTAGLIAASLMAVNPFEVLNATLISTDVNLSVYILLSVYFFIRGQKEFRPLYLCLSAVFIFFSFINKPFGLFAVPVLMIFFFTQHGWRPKDIWKNIWKYKPFIITLVGTFGFFFLMSWILTNDPFIFKSIYDRETWARLNEFQLMIYPRQMFFANEFGEHLHGYHFYFVVGAILLIRRNNWKQVFPVLAWFLILFCCIEFLPHRVRDGIPYTAQRIFRYLVFIVPPSILFVAYFWNRLKNKHIRVFTFCFIAYLAASTWWAFDATSVVRIAFGEVRSALKYLKGLGDVDVYAEWYFISKLERLEYKGIRNPRLHYWRDTETPEAWKAKFARVQEGYVVTGGPRLPYYANYGWIPNLADFKPPNTWELVKEYDPKLYPPWKTEPLRIWRVSYDNKLPEKIVTIPDTALNACLRKSVYPLRPEDGLPLYRPITERLANKVTKIECGSSGIVNTAGLEKFVNTEILNLAKNKITHLDVSSMSELRMLIASGNRLSKIKGLKNLNQLHTLWLAGNRLKSLDVSGLTTIRDLRVDANQLTRLDGTSNLHNLLNVYIGKNPGLNCADLQFPNEKTVINGCSE